jgi:hypothetical protein
MADLKEMMESEEMSLFVETNQELINETTEAVNEFKDVLVEYVTNNTSLFVEEDIQDMYKNIRLFSEVATEQFLHEIVTANSEKAQMVEVLTPENAMNEYL